MLNRSDVKIFSCILLSLVFLTLGNAQGNLGRLLTRAYPYIDDTTPQIIVISFTDKGGTSYRPEELLSPRAIQRRQKARPSRPVVDEADFPIVQSYVRIIEHHVVRVRHQLKWFNAVSAVATKPQIEELRRLPFVNEIELVGRWKSGRSRQEISQTKYSSPFPRLSQASSFDYGASHGYLEQIDVPAVHDLGIYGQGVVVCMFDEGVRSPDDPMFDSLNIIATHDFVDHKESVVPYDPGAGGHGYFTLETLGAFAPGSIIGPAFKASILLARTENDSSETPIEEDNWVKGIEWADSIGVDVTSTSLVYLAFDAPYPSMTWEDMDGMTALITRAGDRADSLGIVVLNAAGNAGRDSTHNTLCAPADGFHIITVGAVDTLGNIMSFSSNGPTVDGRIKPDVMAMGMGGTSQACPLAAGVAALVLCANPGLTPAQVREAMKSTASDASSPDNYHGWGILNALAAVNYFGIVNHIAGSVFEDRNGNGKRDYNEGGIPGVPVKISGPISDSVLSDEHGRFLFDSLAFGQYGVSASEHGSRIILPEQGSYHLTLDSARRIEGTINFGLFRPATVRGRVFLDRNLNGSYDGQDTTLGNWPVLLSGPDASVCMTDSTGQYSFADLGPGVYTVRDSLPPSWEEAVPQSGYSFTVSSCSGLDTTLPSFGNVYVPARQAKIAEGWNLLSLPFPGVSAPKDSLFPLSISHAFLYNGRYQTTDTIRSGLGYWLKFQGAAGMKFTDLPISTDTITVRGGWNMIGSVSCPVPADSIQSLPPGMITSQFYSYLPSGTYAGADTINPGFGYWVKVNQAGSLLLSASGPFSYQQRIHIVASLDEPPPPPDGEMMEGVDRLPARFALLQNYPNPFNPTTTIAYEMPQASFVTLKIFNLLGQEVAALVNEQKEAGRYGVHFDGSRLPSGVYFLRFTAGTFTQTQEMVLLR